MALLENGKKKDKRCHVCGKIIHDLDEELCHRKRPEIYPNKLGKVLSGVMLLVIAFMVLSYFWPVV